MRISCEFHIRGAIVTFEGTSSSLSFPFEGFDEMFVTKSGIVVVVIESSGPSTTILNVAYSEWHPISAVILHSRSGLTSGFFLKEVGSSSSSPSSPKLRSFVSLVPEVRRGVDQKPLNTHFLAPFFL